MHTYLLFTDSVTFHIISHTHWMFLSLCLSVSLFLCALQKHNKVMKFLLLHKMSFEEEMSLLPKLMLRRHAICLLSHLFWLWPLKSCSWCWSTPMLTLWLHLIWRIILKNAQKLLNSFLSTVNNAPTTPTPTHERAHTHTHTASVRLEWDGSCGSGKG